MSGDRGVIVLAVAIIALVLIGEVAAYGNLYGYDSVVSEDGSFKVSSSGSNVYDVISSDNGSFQSVRKLIVYSDGGYGGVVHGVTVEVGARALDEEYYLSQLSNNLGYLGFSNIVTADASSLRDALAKSDPAGTGLVVVHGALPDTVYSGSPDDAILSWICNGGTLYWAGEALGKYIGHADGTVGLAPEGCQSLFLGSECILDLEISDVPSENRNVGRAYSRADSDGYSEALHMKNNNVLYGVDPSLLDGREALCTGYCQDGHYSASLVSLGSGCVCVMGGTFSNYQRMDLANIIASGIGPASTLAGTAHGTVAHGTAEGSVPVSGGNSSVFVLLGGDFSVYGRTFYKEAP